MSNETGDIANQESKKHFEVLDGLRGVAAFSVVIFHFMEWVFPDYTLNFIGHGYLAVDFFFCLSGFVIGYAYDSRIGGLGILRFFKARLIRLHPLVAMGSILGLLVFLFDPLAPDAPAYGAGKLFLIWICSLLLVPLPVMQERGFNLFGLNAPSWSLFWEYVANVFYALVLRRVSRRMLAMMTLLAALALCFVSHRAGNLLGGWGGDNFWDGCARVSYSFAAGLLVFRSGWIIPHRLGFAGLSILLSAAFLMPFIKANWLVDAALVIFYFPLLVALGAGSTLSSRLKKFCAFSGRMSYPLYMTHYAAMSLFGSYYLSIQPGTNQLVVVVVAGTVFMVGMAWLVMRLYDEPLRNYLSRRGRARKAS